MSEAPHNFSQRRAVDPSRIDDASLAATLVTCDSRQDDQLPQSQFCVFDSTLFVAEQRIRGLHCAMQQVKQRTLECKRHWRAPASITTQQRVDRSH
jgi:hypothetical protein